MSGGCWRPPRARIACRNALIGLALLLATRPATAAAQHKPAAPAWPPPVTLPAAPALASGSSPENLQESGGRHTKRGLVIGAIAGALGGLGIGTFIYLFCEGENDDCGPVIPIVTVLGAASGAAAGAIIGAAIPRGDERARVDPEPEGQQAEPVARRIGSFSAALGWASATIHEGSREAFSGSGPALRLGLMAELLPSLAIGPEVGQAWFDEGGNIRHGALALRGTLPRPRISPYASANLGAYQATRTSLEFLGGGLGLGARVRPLGGDRFFVDVEGRYSRHTQNIEPMRMRTVWVGGGLYW